MIIKLYYSLNKVLLFVLWSVLCLSSILNVSIADDNQDCHRFWAKCHVSEIKTIHTDDEKANSRLLDTIKNAINWCLWILATITLCVCLYWWFKMLTSGTDSKWYDNWLKVLKNALLWLAIILLAWMIVSVVFWFVATMSGWNQTRSTWVS